MNYLKKCFSITNTMRPYLSVVIAARNDNYGGDFETRVQNCINWFAHYAGKFGLQAEFLIVDYNSGPTRAPLAEALNLHKMDGCLFKIIEVPPLFHRQRLNEGIRMPLPFFEYVAKNIGIRRASGEYILCMNPDVLLDPSIIKAIADGRGLTEGCYYRADRYDYTGVEGLIEPGNTVLDLVRKNGLSVCAKGRDFALGFKYPFFAAVGLYKLKSFAFRKYYFFLKRHRGLANALGIDIHEPEMSYRLHTNASGDFLLMHRNNWFKIQGYPQNMFLPVHSDLSGVIMAYFSGLKEKVFFYPVYHKEHERRFHKSVKNETADEIFLKFENDGRQMENLGKVIPYNDSEWGYVNEVFEVKEYK